MKLKKKHLLWGFGGLLLWQLLKPKTAPANPPGNPNTPNYPDPVPQSGADSAVAGYRHKYHDNL